jgi:hypothetical protein
MRDSDFSGLEHTSKLQLSAMGPRLLELLALLVDALNLGRLGWLVQGWP